MIVLLNAQLKCKIAEWMLVTCDQGPGNGEKDVTCSAESSWNIGRQERRRFPSADEKPHTCKPTKNVGTKQGNTPCYLTVQIISLVLR